MTGPLRRLAWMAAWTLLGCSAERHPEVTPAPWRNALPRPDIPAQAPARCRRSGALPDPACTPGATMTSDLGVICHESTRRRRHVDEALRRKVFALYGEAPATPGTFEVDHLIPLELGGSNAVENLWPEPEWPAPGFREKDHVESWLHERVCAGAIPLAQAQRVIATDWVRVWRRIRVAERWDPNPESDPLE